jgi:hypothetical protein
LPSPTGAAANDSASTAEDTPVTIEAGERPRIRDRDLLTVVIAADAGNGTVITINPDGTLRYVPNADFNGTDTITLHDQRRPWRARRPRPSPSRVAAERCAQSLRHVQTNLDSQVISPVGAFCRSRWRYACLTAPRPARRLDDRRGYRRSRARRLQR